MAWIIVCTRPNGSRAFRKASSSFSSDILEAQKFAHDDKASALLIVADVTATARKMRVANCFSVEAVA